MYWGYHLMLDISGCNENIKNKEVIYKFSKDLVEKIDMVAYGEPIIEFMLPDDPKQGITLMQLITTSNICAHFVDKDMTGYLDIFSCKPFDINVAQEVVRNFFEPKKIRVNYITRNAD